MAAPPAASEETAPTLQEGPADSRAQSVLALAFRASMALVALSVPVLLLARSSGQPMSQVWILAVTLCTYAFVFLLRIWRSWWFTTDLLRLSYGLLLAHYAEGHVGTRTAVFALHLATAWAAAYLGYSLALHRLRNGTERAIVDGALPSPCCHSKDRAREIASEIPCGAAVVTVVWTAFMAALIRVLDLINEPEQFDEMDIFLFLSYFGWIHVALWLIPVAAMAMHGALMKDPLPWLMAGLIPWMFVSPLIIILSRDLFVWLQWLLMVALLAFLGYNLAVYLCYRQTAEDEPATTTRSFSSVGNSTLAEPVPGETS